MHLSFKRPSFRRLLAAVLLVASSAASAEKLQDIKLEITTYLGDAQTFVEGDDIAFMLSLDHPAYVYLYYQDAAHNLIQILPNREQTDNHYAAGLFIPVPDPKAGFKFIVQPPFGEERLWAFASDKALKLQTDRSLPNGMAWMTQGIEAIRQQIRQQSTAIFGQDVLTMKTIAREQ
jgi:hypothetical protein